MVETSLEHVLHYRCPEWGESIQSTRKASGFSFDLQPEVLWRWLATGGHERLKDTAAAEVQRLGIPEFSAYYLSCVYSDYERPGGTFDFDAIQGPPWFNLSCPAMQYGPKWRESVEAARLGLYHKFNADPSTMPFPLVEWLWHEGVDELFDVAVRQVAELAMESWTAVLWVCCVLPPGTKYMVTHTTVLYQQFPDLMDWENFGLWCEDCPAHLRCRAYPSHIDWNRGTQAPKGFPVLSPLPGIRYAMYQGKTMTLGITWDPLVAPSEADLCNAVKSLNRYWRQRYRERDIQAASGILPILSEQKAKGGRPRGGSAADAIAVECARLKDEEGFTYKKIAEHMDWAVQGNAYGKPSYSSKAKRMVIRGRELLRTQVMEMGQ